MYQEPPENEECNAPAPQTALPQIAVVERHPLVRRGLESLLLNSPRVQLAATAAEPPDLPPTAHGGRWFDTIVHGATETGQAFSDGIEALAQRGRVLVLADFSNWRPVTDALRTGAFGCVDRQAEEEELLSAVATVAQGGLYVAPGLASQLQSELRQPVACPPPSLGQREAETLRWLAAGLTHREIARRMGLTETTISTYVKRIRNKLNVGNKADLTRMAIRFGLLANEFEDATALPIHGRDGAVHSLPPVA
jgi:DNA-binding NarL/FixJ family response regulator